MKKFLTILALAALACFTVACLDHVTGPTIINDNQNNNGNPQPTPSPSPGVQACEVGSLDLGTVGDDFEFAPGETIGLSLSVYGSQGVELTEVCRNQITVAFDTPTGPCGPVEGAWYNAKVRANTTAVAGQTCSTRARSGSKVSGYVTLAVVAP